MPIEFLSKSQIESNPISHRDLGPRNKKTATPQTNLTDNVSFSANAKLFMEAKQAAQAAPDVRTDRVEALKPLVQSGTYPLDSKKIAADLIATEPGLFI